MRPEQTDFSEDIPLDLVVEGSDAFDERGRFLLFIEMIGSIAKDLCAPVEGLHHQESAEWIANPDNMQLWCDMIDADARVVPVLCKAIQTKPREIAKACENLVRSGHTDAGGDLTRFTEAMGVKRTQNRSNLPSWEDQESESETLR